MNGNRSAGIRRKLTGAVIATLALGLGVGWPTAAGAARVAATSADGLPVFGPGKDYHPNLDPANFSPNVDNPYFPLEPGTVYVYGGTEGGKSAVNVLTVTSKTKVIDGVTNRVIEDRVFVNGRLGERTRDYYSQDKAGNVWYFGEDTGLVKHGKVTTGAGSWHSGVDGAEAGVYMQASPELDRRFRQEWYKGHAEDQYKAVDLSSSITVPYMSSQHALKTEETTALEPKALDNKFYVKGIGQVVERSVKGPEETLVLIDVIHAG
jgi:hypothetical protein